MSCDRYFYDNNLIYRGTIHDDNSFTDEHGCYAGRMIDNVIYNANGNYCGYVDSFGSLYDQHNIYRGRVESDGTVYDSNSCYVGRASR